MSDKTPTRIFETADLAKEARVTPAAVRASLQREGITPDFTTGRASLYSAQTVATWRERRHAKGLAA